MHLNKFRSTLFSLWLVGVAFAVPAVAQTPPVAPSAPVRKTVAVLSVVGDVVQAMHIGLTVFNNAHASRKLDWKIDRILAERVVQALAERFDAHAIEVDGEALAKAALEPSFLSGGVDLEPALRASVKPGLAELLLVVTPRVREDPFKNSKALARGIGLYTVQNIFRGRFFGHTYLVCAMTVFDGQTLKKLDEDKCQNDDGFGEPKVPFQKVDAAVYKTELVAMSAEQLEQLRQAVLRMIDETVPLTLAELKMIGPPKPARQWPERPPQEESTR